MNLKIEQKKPPVWPTERKWTKKGRKTERKRQSLRYQWGYNKRSNMCLSIFHLLKCSHGISSLCIVVNMVNYIDLSLKKKSSPKDTFIDFRERRRGGESERERETLSGCLPYMPDQGLNLQPRYMPCLEIKPTTFAVLGDTTTGPCWFLSLSLSLFGPHPRTFFKFLLERGEGDLWTCERIIDWSPPLGAQSRDWCLDPGLHKYRMGPKPAT